MDCKLPHTITAAFTPVSMQTPIPQMSTAFEPMKHSSSHRISILSIHELCSFIPITISGSPICNQINICSIAMEELSFWLHFQLQIRMTK